MITSFVAGGFVTLLLLYWMRSEKDKRRLEQRIMDLEVSRGFMQRTLAGLPTFRLSDEEKVARQSQDPRRFEDKDLGGMVEELDADKARERLEAAGRTAAYRAQHCGACGQPLERKTG